ncbi:MAG: hypothetical protein II059_08525 [Clostridia bacterium]|nr:hypothetical protein [Clostridia bacterium]
MSIYLKLVKALIASVEPTPEEKGRKKIFYGIMAFIAVFFIMIPMAFLIGIIIYVLTTQLIKLDAGSNAAELFLQLTAVFSFVFGLNVIFSVFYFSGDIESLLPLPLRSSQIIASKFTAALISESFMEFIIIIAVFAGYIIAAGLPFYTWIIAVFGMITLPIVPLAYCAVICIMVMLITGFVKNKDTVNKITGVLTFAVIIGLAALVSKSGGLDTEHLVQALSDRNNSLIGIMGIIFPHISFLVNSMTEHTILNLLCYIGINILAIAVFMIIAEVFYIDTVAGVSKSAVSKKKTLEKSISSVKAGHPAVTYLKKEFRILFRTPAYFMNCILINLIWPIFLYLIYVLQGKTNFLDSFIDGIHSGNERYVLIFVLGVSAVSVLVTAANCIASSALTREGSHLAFIKYIPMSYMAQINIKALVSIIISGAGMLIYVIAASVYLHLGIMLMTFCCVISLLSVAFASYFGIFMDSINPKLIWDSELNALRGNYNIFFNMAMAILLEGVTCAGAYLAFKYTHIGSLIIMLSLFILLMTLTAVSYLLCKFKATANIDRLSV